MISISTQIESNYEISICPRCHAEHYTHQYNEYGCHCLSEKEREKLKKRKQQWKEMQARAAEKQRLKREALKNDKEYQNKIKAAQNAKNKPVNKISDKQRILNEQIRKVKHEVREKAFDNNEYYCKGCNKAVPLDCSHNIAVSQSKEKAADYDNIVLLCRKCHAKYESNDPKLMKELSCIDEILEYLRINNPERYFKKMYKLNREF